MWVATVKYCKIDGVFFKVIKLIFYRQEYKMEQKATDDDVKVKQNSFLPLIPSRVVVRSVLPQIISSS